MTFTYVLGATRKEAVDLPNLTTIYMFALVF